MPVFRATDAKEVSDVVTWAAGEEQPLELVAGGSKRGLGRPMQIEHVLDLSGLSGIRDYEAAELVLTGAAATPLADIEATLEANNQMLAFEPADWRQLLGQRQAPRPLAARSPATWPGRAASGPVQPGTISSGSRP